MRSCQSALAACLVSSLLAAQEREGAFGSFAWRNIGPANMGGRIVDIEAVEKDWRQVFLAHASGGVFKSTNAGASWQPIFDRYRVSSIGDIAIFQPNPEILWVGTGEANNRNSVSWGNGIYKS
ncbi:MAG: WD40/YVTN/BNR-like repeat-containing protein, partial [Planctomycetota bacterium]